METNTASVPDLFGLLPAALQPCILTLVDHGWSLAIEPDRPTDVRKRLLAHHPTGAQALVIARPCGQVAKWRVSNNRYFLRPNGEGLWLKARGMQAFTSYLETLQVDTGHVKPFDQDPLDTPGVRNTAICGCRKRRFTHSKAERVLLGAKIKYAEGDIRRRECRAYRCDDDQRVWHLTSWTSSLPSC